jgi:hypothetical protein
MTIHLRPPPFDFSILRDDGLKVGEVGFDLVEIPNQVSDTPAAWEAPSSPNIPTLSYVTKKGLLRSNIAKKLGLPPRTRIRRAFVGTGTWVHQRYAYRQYGRSAMRLFLEQWAPVADLVVIRASPIQRDGDRPDQDHLAHIWEEVGFTRLVRRSFTLFYAPKPLTVSPTTCKNRA